MGRPFKRMILIQPTGREDFLAYAADAGMVYRSEVQEERETFTPYELIYSDDERQTWVHYVEDFVADMRYVVVTGLDLEEVVEHVAANLPVYGDAQLLAWTQTAEDPRELAAAVRHLAVAAPESFDPDVLTGLLRGLRHPDPVVRVVSVYACAYPGWPELKPEIERIWSSDPDYRVRDAAGHLLDVYREAGK